MIKRFARLLLAISVLSLSIAAAPADDLDTAANRLALFTTIPSVAMACGDPESTGSDAADVIWQRLNQQVPALAARVSRSALNKLIFEGVKRDEQILKDGHGKYFDKPCSYYRSMASTMIESKGEVLSFVEDKATSPAPPAAQESGRDPSREALRKQLEDLSAKLSKGGLKDVAGCWAATTPNWTLRTCFTDGGDSVNVQIVSTKGTFCRLTSGAARQRSDAIFFYAFAEPPVCSDKSPIEHVEAICERGNPEMTCLFSFFSHSNYMFALPNQDATSDINGKLKLSRK
jgi:hypothetical protein